MKSFLVLLVLTATATFSATASASSVCKVDLKNGRGMLLETFRGYDYYQEDACRDAKRSCRQVKRSGYYRARIQTCTVRFNRRPIQRRSCTVGMQNRRGRTVDVFTAVSGPRQSLNACQKARRQCQRAKVRQGRRGASCQVLSRGPIGRRGDRHHGRRGRGGRRG